ncbi:unnamed protein product, partial [Mesorhabditis belari]|uniref:Uncharacterized protein n=1 Tax=Mesorhabditis belari TaxID=2138241 RepID=A0AAF3JC22_9BILA
MLTRSAILLLLALLGVSYAAVQTVSVVGRLTCNGRPYSGAKLKLYDDNTILPDTKLAQVNSDANGMFQLTGTSSNLVFSADPKFNIYHRCGMTVPVCQYKSSYKIPKQYVNSGSQSNNQFNAQTIELTLLKKDRDCIN